MSKTVDWSAKARDDARDMAENFLDNIVEQLLDKGEASDDYSNDYPDGDAYHHEQHVDRSYDLLEAAELLDELDDYEETDAGLWHGQGPREAIATQAAFTYGNAVSSMWSDLIKRINEDDDVLASLAITEGLTEEDDCPPLDKDGKDWDDALDVFGHDETGPLIDCASDHGYKWSAQLQAGYHHDFLTEAREKMVRDYVSTIIKEF